MTAKVSEVRSQGATQGVFRAVAGQKGLAGRQRGEWARLRALRPDRPHVALAVNARCNKKAMIELQPADFPQAAQNISAFISLDAVKCSALEGKQAGRVFGDDEQNFLVLHASGFCFVHLNDADHIPASVPQLLQKLKSERAWIGVLLSPALDHSIAERLMPRGYGERTRLAFTFARERFLGPPG